MASANVDSDTATPSTEQPQADQGPTSAAAIEQEQPQTGAGGKQTTEPRKKSPRKPSGPRPADIVARIGDRNEQALAYVLAPDPALSRLSRKVREDLLADLPPVTAGALLGPAALARHLIASAAAGRYRDLFALWELFRERPADCKPILADRSRALAKAREAMKVAVHLGLRGHADRVAQDIDAAQGLIWQWLREIVVAELPAVGERPAIAAALLRREPDLDIPLPDPPGDRWMAEAAALRLHDALPPALDAVFSANVERLPANPATLTLAAEHYPDRVQALLGRVDLDAPDIGATLAWARDHGGADLLRDRIQRQVEDTALKDPPAGLALWYRWRAQRVALPLPQPLRVRSLDGFDLAQPETAELAAHLLSVGVPLQPQEALDELAQGNRQRGEKAYEAFVCAGLDVHLPMVLEDNRMVRDGTRCEWCRAWTWVRPGHERRCPRRSAA